MMRLLINFGKTANEQDYDLNTVLHLSAQLIDAALVQLLLDNEADPSAENVHGQTPLPDVTF